VDQSTGIQSGGPSTSSTAPLLTAWVKLNGRPIKPFAFVGLAGEPMDVGRSLSTVGSNEKVKLIFDPAPDGNAVHPMQRIVFVHPTNNGGKYRKDLFGGIAPEMLVVGGNKDKWNDVFLETTFDDDANKVDVDIRKEVDEAKRTGVARPTLGASELELRMTMAMMPRLAKGDFQAALRAGAYVLEHSQNNAGRAAEARLIFKMYAVLHDWKARRDQRCLIAWTSASKGNQVTVTVC
jgi:hypothetical protein